jgi:hypothetical protein
LVSAVAGISINIIVDLSIKSSYLKSDVAIKSSKSNPAIASTAAEIPILNEPY